MVVGSLVVSTVFAQNTSAVDPVSVVSPPLVDGVKNSLDSDTFQTGGKGDFSLIKRDKDRLLVGFAFANHGGNNTLTQVDQANGAGPNRTWEFHFDDRARQNIYLSVVDQPNEFLSQLMNSDLLFFPRKVLPAMSYDSEKFTVTLPNEETVIFNAKTKETMGGVLRETRPVDLSTDKWNRKFAGIEYTGTGVMLRVDKRGSSTRFGTTALITQGTKKCKVPSAKLFNQDPAGATVFLFATDESFNEFLKKTCNISFL